MSFLQECRGHALPPGREETRQALRRQRDNPDIGQTGFGHDARHHEHDDHGRCHKQHRPPPTHPGPDKPTQHDNATDQKQPPGQRGIVLLLAPEGRAQHAPIMFPSEPDDTGRHRQQRPARLVIEPPRIEKRPVDRRVHQKKTKQQHREPNRKTVAIGHEKRQTHKHKINPPLRQNPGHESPHPFREHIPDVPCHRKRRHGAIREQAVQADVGPRCEASEEHRGAERRRDGSRIPSHRPSSPWFAGASRPSCRDRNAISFRRSSFPVCRVPRAPDRRTVEWC